MRYRTLVTLQVLAVIVAVAIVAASRVRPAAQVNLAAEALDGLDRTLDQYVREGLVYYRALQIERASLDRFVRSVANVSLTGAPRDDRLAFWLNVYNALVLRTVIDHYPTGGRSTLYPQGSVRQIPGAFEQIEHRVAGGSVTLDQMERVVLSEFNDPRVYFALGRGARGSGRLRSAVFTGDDLEGQLSAVHAECLRRDECVSIDRSGNRVLASSIFSWRSVEFVAVYAAHADPRFANRSPIERAVLAYIDSQLLPGEREFLMKNGFELQFAPFDWELNDLTGR